MRAQARSNVALSGWPRGEVRDVPVDRLTVRRVEEGTITVLSQTAPQPLLPAADSPAVPDVPDDGEHDGEDV
jgi:hypothetical protein